MIVHVFDTPAQVARAAAAVFSAQILKKPDSVLGLATGGTPVDTYKELIKLHQDGILDFSQVTTFNLDEYEGLPTSHPESYVAFMKRNLFDHVNIKQSRLPDGLNKDHQKECAAYDEEIRQAGGVDLQLLGIGNNGHIGFNEPDTKFVYNTHIVDLTESTIQANTRFFDSEKDVPRQAISLGSGGIMRARKIVLVAFGEGKAEAVKYMVQGDIDPQWQGSILRIHPDVTVLLDEAAASKL